MFLKRFPNYFILLILFLYFTISFNRNYLFRDILSISLDSVKKNLTNPRANYNLALALKEDSKYSESIVIFERLITIDPLYKRLEVWKLLGENYLFLGDLKKAKKYFEKVMWIRPDIKILSSLAEIYYIEKNYKVSISFWRATLKMDSTNKIALKRIEEIKSTLKGTSRGFKGD